MRIDLDLPTPHTDQMRAWTERERFNVLRCGRRWGKTQLAINILCQFPASGQMWGLFAPDYKILSETYRDLESALRPLTAHSSKTDGLIRLITGGRVDFWTLNNPRAGRSRKYHGVIVDEAAFAGPDMWDIWNKAIMPTLLDFRGSAWAMSTPAGKDEDNWFYRVCTDKSLGWKEYYAPTANNPHLPADEIERLREANPPEVFQQEYLAEFVDWYGVSFFGLDSLLDDGEPVDIDWRTDQVFCVIDTASKTDASHDGTGVIWFAKSRFAGVPLVILDWDVVQIEASLLIDWLPGINTLSEQYANELQAREGNVGMFIEDKDSGIALLQAGPRNGLPTVPIESGMTSQGKDARAVAASPYVYQGQVKLSRRAFDKTKRYRQQDRNHLIAQVCGYRVGEKQAHSMDLLDCFTYGATLALGNQEGY